MAATQGLRVEAERVGVVAHRFTYGVIETERLLERVTAGTAVLFGELHHRRVVTIDEAAGTQILAHYDVLLGSPESSDSSSTEITTFRPNMHAKTREWRTISHGCCPPNLRKPSGVSHEFNHHVLTTRFTDAV